MEQNIQNNEIDMSEADQKKIEALIGDESLQNFLNTYSPDQDADTMINSVLALSDESFAVISSLVIEEYKKSLNTEEGKKQFIHNFLENYDNFEDYYQYVNDTVNEINDVDELDQMRKNFLIGIVEAGLNLIYDLNDEYNSHLYIPVERTSDDIKIPTYETVGAAGMDIYSPADYTIEPGETVVIPTGLKVAIPEGYALLIHPRSGLSARSKLRICNSIGLIDSDYRDEIKVIIENVDSKIRDIELSEGGRVKAVTYGSPCYIEKGQRFAQMRLVQVPLAAFYEVEDVSGIGEDRGGGLGSTDEPHEEVHEEVPAETSEDTSAVTEGNE